MVKFIAWDRDGVINELVNHDGKLTAPWHINEFQFKPNIKEALQKSKSMGFLNFVITNQPDVKDGWLLKSHLDLMSKMILNWLPVDEIMIALDRNTSYYKPNNQMILDLMKKYNIDGNSYLIGDTWKDIVCGYKSDLNTIFIGDYYYAPKDYSHIRPNNMVNGIMEAVYLIEEMELHD